MEQLKESTEIIKEKITKLCYCGRAPIIGKTTKCRICNVEHNKKYRKLRKCPHCNNLLNIKSSNLSPQELAAIKAQTWHGPAEPNFKYLAPENRKKLFEEIAELINKTNISEKEHDLAVEKIKLHKKSHHCPYAVFVGFHVLYNGQWWKVIEAGAELIVNRRIPHQSKLRTETIQRTDVEDVRCGPGGKFVMLQKPPGKYHKPLAKWKPTLLNISSNPLPQQP